MNRKKKRLGKKKGKMAAPARTREKGWVLSDEKREDKARQDGERVSGVSGLVGLEAPERKKKGRQTGKKRPTNRGKSEVPRRRQGWQVENKPEQERKSLPLVLQAIVMKNRPCILAVSGEKPTWKKGGKKKRPLKRGGCHGQQNGPGRAQAATSVLMQNIIVTNHLQALGGEWVAWGTGFRGKRNATATRATRPTVGVCVFFCPKTFESRATRARQK
jgi:hypothetical protein